MEMFSIESFLDIEDAISFIFEALSPDGGHDSFSITYSPNAEECSVETTDIESLAATATEILRDLDAAEGVIEPVMINGSLVFDFRDHPSAVDEYYQWPPPKKVDSVFAPAGEGVTVIHNTFASGPFSYPIIVVKRSAYNRFRDELLDRLKPGKHRGEYTEAVTPAVYIELGV